MNIGVLGLGLMGRAIAERLLLLGHRVRGWNRTRERLGSLVEQGLIPAIDVADVIDGSEFVILTLADAAAIEVVLFAADSPPELAGSTLLQMGTIGPAESRDIGARVTACGGEYLEAPVLGSLPEARAGKLIIMAGGPAPLFERCLPLLQALGPAPERIGEVGQGAALKLAMNQLIASLTAGFSYSLGLVRSEGVEVERFMKLLRGSALYAPTFDKKLAKYLSHDYEQPNFPLKHLLKDVALFAQVAEAEGMDSILPRALLELLSKGADDGCADRDYSALYELVNPSR